MQLSGVPIYDKYQHCQSTSKPDLKRPSESESAKPSRSKGKKRRKTIDHEIHSVKQVTERVKRYVDHLGQVAFAHIVDLVLLG